MEGTLVIVDINALVEAITAVEITQELCVSLFLYLILFNQYQRDIGYCQ